MAPEAVRLAFGAALVVACGAVVPATASERSQLNTIRQRIYQFDEVTTCSPGALRRLLRAGVGCWRDRRQFMLSRGEKLRVTARGALESAGGAQRNSWKATRLVTAGVFFFFFGGWGKSKGKGTCAAVRARGSNQASQYP